MWLIAYFRLVLEFSLVTLSVSVVLCLTVQIRRGNAYYGTAFFRLFVATSVAELVNYLLVSNP